VKAPPAPIFSTENEKFIVPAAQYHGVNYFVLRAILKVESGLNPNAVGRNNNGTVDVGMGQMNSMHFRDLAKFGIEPGHLRDPCISTYVAAWHLKKNLIASGNTWEGIARYHSATPYFNQRYQILLKNEMIRSGAMTGSLQAVPSINRSGTGQALAMVNTRGSANVPASLLVVDTSETRQ
jgi:soluble lytic murein transglycosylase-like protein